MKNSINLCPNEPFMRLQQIDKARVIRISALYIGLVMVIWVGLKVQLFLVNQDLNELKEQHSSVKSEISNVQKQNKTTDDTFAELKKELENKTTELNNSKKAQAYLQDLPMKMPLYAFQNFLSQLDQVDSQSVWLNKISLDNGGLNIQGLAQQCSDIGSYSQRLNQLTLNDKPVNISNFKIDYESSPCQFVAQGQ